MRWASSSLKNRPDAARRRLRKALGLVNYDRLVKILQHELSLGCTNKAVINGLESFVSHWQNESLAQGVSLEEQARVQQLVQSLSTYSASDPSERAQMLSTLLQQLNIPVVRQATGPTPV